MNKQSYHNLLLEQCVICEANIERYESGIATCMERVKKLKAAIAYFEPMFEELKLADGDVIYVMSEYLDHLDWELQSREDDAYRFSGELDRNRVTLETLRNFINKEYQYE